MRDVLPDLDHVTPEWLTEVLQDQGHVQDGCVMAVHLQKTWPTAVSLVAHLAVQYTDDTSVSLPSQLFLKTSQPDLIADFPLRGQVAFYTRIAAAMPAPLIVRCYDAVFAPEARYHTQLLIHGIAWYDWDACWYDYRLAAIRTLFIPMGRWAAKLWPAIWWSHLERALLAFEDLQCRELL